MAAMPSDYDMVIVGLGPAGSVMAREMARAGMRVLALEKGPAYTAEDFVLKHDEIRYHVRLQLSPDVVQDPITWRPRATERARVLPWAVGPLHLGPLFLPPTTGVGGGSIHWAASARRPSRAPPWSTGRSPIRTWSPTTSWPSRRSGSRGVRATSTASCRRAATPSRRRASGTTRCHRSGPVPPTSCS